MVANVPPDPYRALYTQASASGSAVNYPEPKWRCQQSAVPLDFILLEAEKPVGHITVLKLCLGLL